LRPRSADRTSCLVGGAGDLFRLAQPDLVGCSQNASFKLSIRWCPRIDQLSMHALIDFGAFLEDLGPPTLQENMSKLSL
jgi:hypothetical protein